MRRTIVAPSVAWLAAGILLGPAACKEPNPDFDGPAGGSGSESSTTATTPTTDPMPMTMSGMDGTSSTSLPVDDTTSDTTPPDTSSGGTLETTEGSSSSGGEEPLYPPCMLDEDPVCPRPYEECYDFLAPDYSVCTLPCEQDEDCPVPASGDAQPTCGGQGNDQCVLDCSDDVPCPDGMECQLVGGMFERCLWPS